MNVLEIFGDCVKKVDGEYGEADASERLRAAVALAELFCRVEDAKFHQARIDKHQAMMAQHWSGNFQAKQDSTPVCDQVRHFIRNGATRCECGQLPREEGSAKRELVTPAGTWWADLDPKVDPAGDVTAVFIDEAVSMEPDAHLVCGGDQGHVRNPTRPDRCCCGALKFDGVFISLQRKARCEGVQHYQVKGASACECGELSLIAKDHDAVHTVLGPGNTKYERVPGAWDGVIDETLKKASSESTPRPWEKQRQITGLKNLLAACIPVAQAVNRAAAGGHIRHVQMTKIELTGVEIANFMRCVGICTKGEYVLPAFMLVSDEEWDDYVKRRADAAVREGKAKNASEYFDAVMQRVNDDQVARQGAQSMAEAATMLSIDHERLTEMFYALKKCRDDLFLAAAPLVKDIQARNILGHYGDDAADVINATVGAMRRLVDAHKSSIDPSKFVIENLPTDLLEEAWILLCNSHCGDWGNATDEWRQSVHEFKKKYNSFLSARHDGKISSIAAEQVSGQVALPGCD